ncbi:MAG: YtxH domain-containing protein [Bacillus sp. (in: firmicutes)]
METNRMTSKEKKNRLMQGVLVGALAGAAISMLDRDTRESVMNGCKNSYKRTKTLIQNPEYTVGNLKEKTNRIKHTVESITEDVMYISGKLQEIKDVPPQVASVVKETKEAFVDTEGEVVQGKRTD